MLVTIGQMYTHFLLGLNKANAGTVTPAQFNVIINGATVTYLTEKADAMEGDQRVQDTLRVLIDPPAQLVNQGQAQPDFEFFDLPYNANAPAGTSKGYYRMVSLAMHLMRPGNPPAPVPCSAPNGWVNGRPLRRDTRHIVMQDPFNSPTDTEPYYYLTNDNRVRIVTDGTSYADRILVEYLRYPVEMNVISGQEVQPELPGAINQEITDLALRKYLEVIESRRYQTQVTEKRLNP